MQNEVVSDLRTDAPLTPFSYVRMVKDELHEDVPFGPAIETSYYLSLWGYATNGHVLALFGDPEIASLWKRYQVLQPKIFAETKERFWTSLGTRIEFTRAHIAELESRSTTKGRDDDTGGSPS